MASCLHYSKPIFLAATILPVIVYRLACLRANFMLQQRPSSVEEFGIGLCVQISCISSSSPRHRKSALCFACELCESAAAVLSRGGQLYALRASFVRQQQPSTVVQVCFASYKILYSMGTYAVNQLQACFSLLSELLLAKCAAQLHYCMVVCE